MRSRDEVLREFELVGHYESCDLYAAAMKMADRLLQQEARIRELEAQLSAVVARETQRESGKSILRGIAAPEVYRG